MCRIIASRCSTGTYFLTSPVQFKTTVIGSDATSFITVTIRNFWPSAVASQCRVLKQMVHPGVCSGGRSGIAERIELGIGGKKPACRRARASHPRKVACA